jgi:predicted nuclease of predicted toxin-antitoxin system
MKIVADENIDFQVIRKLRNAGFEVFSISENLASIKDNEVIAVANEQNALLITEDKDFGELVFRLRLPNRGVLLIRLSDDLPREVASDRILDVILKYNETLFDSFSVLDNTNIRIRSYKK